MNQLVLSLFPGIGILDKAFEDGGFTVVRGPDLLWGGDVKRFHPPAGRFDGVLGGTPCQCFSRLIHIIRHNGYKEGENLIPEFERVITEAQPVWFVMENVQEAPIPAVPGYQVDPSLCDNRWLGNVQSRRHRFSFGTRDGRKLHYNTQALEHPDYENRVLAKHDSLPRMARMRDGSLVPRKTMPRKRSLAECLLLQGLPCDFFDESPFTAGMKRKVLGNAVPYPLGRVLAQAVREALS